MPVSYDYSKILRLHKVMKLKREVWMRMRFMEKKQLKEMGVNGMEVRCWLY